MLRDALGFFNFNIYAIYHATVDHFWIDLSTGSKAYDAGNFTTSAIYRPIVSF